MEQVVSHSLAPREFILAPFGGFAGLALVLAWVGTGTESSKSSPRTSANTVPEFTRVKPLTSTKLMVKVPPNGGTALTGSDASILLLPTAPPLTIVSAKGDFDISTRPYPGGINEPIKWLACVPSHLIGYLTNH